MLKEVTVVGNALVAITDGAFSETLTACARQAGQPADHRRRPRHHRRRRQLKAVVEVYRVKTRRRTRSRSHRAAAPKPPATAADDKPTEEAARSTASKFVDRRGSDADRSENPSASLPTGRKPAARPAAPLRAPPAARATTRLPSRRARTGNATARRRRHDPLRRVPARPCRWSRPMTPVAGDDVAAGRCPATRCG